MEPFVQNRNFTGNFALAVLCWIGLLGICGAPAYGQEHGEKHSRHNGIVQDWSGRHVVFPRIGPVHSLVAAGRDPRAIYSWQQSFRREWHRNRGDDRGGDHEFRFKHHARNSLHRDWSISLGAGGTSAAMYPAKFSFDINAAPDCINDFIVYPINAVGSATQPNLAGFNNLYSGTVGGAGICNRGAPPAGDDGVSATTLWSYNIQAAGGQVTTSPALSLDGTKVAFVETGAGTTAHFHVLAWKTGDGVDLDTPDAQNVLLPVTINVFAAQSPVAGSGTATDLALGSTPSDSDTLSSPYVDYAFDTAYIGNDNGTLFRVQDVFCTVNPACAGGSPPVPSLDATWGTAGALSVCPGSKMSGPVEDSVTGHIFVGCADGFLYGYTMAGTPLANSPFCVGDGTATGGIVDPPLVDAVNGFVYAVSGSYEGSAVIVQLKTADMSAPLTATVGAGGLFNIHAPSFNDAYFSSITSTDWLLYEFASTADGMEVALYGVSFDASHNMTTGTPAEVNTLAFTTLAPFELSPSTEFLNGEDRLFDSAIGLTANNFVSMRIDTFPAGPEQVLTENNPGGTSGIVVDNVDGAAQASSVYFSVLSGNKAVKLTQSGLQ